MIKQSVYVNGVAKMLPQSELTRIVVGQDEDGNNIYGDFYRYYNEDMTIDTVEINKIDKLQAISVINTEYTNKVKALTVDVPNDEVLTWTKQEAEARGYLASNMTETPLLDSLCAARGVTKDRECCPLSYRNQLDHTHTAL